MHQLCRYDWAVGDANIFDNFTDNNRNLTLRDYDLLGPLDSQSCLRRIFLTLRTSLEPH